MSAILSALEIRESCNNILTMSVMHCFRSHVGNGSSSHDLAGDGVLIFRISNLIQWHPSIKVVSGVPERKKVCHRTTFMYTWQP